MCKRLLTWKDFSFLWIVCVIFLSNQSYTYSQTHVQVVSLEKESIRIAYGIEQLQARLTHLGINCTTSDLEETNNDFVKVTVSIAGADDKAKLGAVSIEGAESYTIMLKDNREYAICGQDDTGAMYGCLQLAEEFERAAGPPRLFKPIDENPSMALRMTCVYMCLPTGSRDGGFYDFLWTPENFPWFYDKQHWTEYLDLIAKARYNGLVLWAGHPFTSILRLPKYPEAQELSDEQLQSNIEMFEWITREADRRGIWTMVHFYNIRISHRLAKAHSISIGVHQPSPLVSDYTRHCVTEFVKNYPHVSLMVCLGEYLDSEYDAQWLAEVIIPGIKAGLQAGQKEPPLVLRSHDCPLEEVLARASYSSLYTTSKYSSEALISHVVGGGPGNKDVMSWQFSKDLAQQYPLILELMFISNLQPCQWASPRFERGAIKSCLEIGSKGILHFPISYLDWPYTTEIAAPRVRQIDRDWVYYESWGRAAWNPNLPEDEGRLYWCWRLSERYGVSLEIAGKILDASEASGEIMPHITRALSNQPWNIQSHMLGQTMEQALSISGRWYAPPGETIAQYAEKEAAGKPHEGETPLDAAAKVQADGVQSLRLAEEAAPHITRNQESFSRWLREIKITKVVGDFYAIKTRAAVETSIYFYTRDHKYLGTAEKQLADSLDAYRQLVQLTDGVYEKTGSWDAVQAIPFRKPMTHWKQVLPYFEREWVIFKKNIQYLKANPETSLKDLNPYPPVPVKILSKECQPYKLRVGERPYFSMEPYLSRINPELLDLTAVRIEGGLASRQPYSIEFELTEPAYVFVGFASSPKENWAKPTRDWQVYTKSSVVMHPEESEKEERNENELNTFELLSKNLSPERIAELLESRGEIQALESQDGVQSLDSFESYSTTLDVYTKKFPAGQSKIGIGPGRFIILGFSQGSVSLYPKESRLIQRQYLFTSQFQP